MNYVRGFCCGLAVALASGCLTNAEPLRAPSAGGEAWFEYRSEHFRILSDLRQRDALNVLAEYEHVYVLLSDVTMHGFRAPTLETQAVAFRNADELRPFVPPNIAGIYEPHLPNEPDGAPTMLVSGTLSPFGRTLFAHELAHRFNFVALGDTSTWLNEGLAQYYSTIRGELKDPVVGESDPQNVVASGSVRGSVGDVVYHGWQIPVASLPQASKLLNMSRADFYGESFDGNGPSTYEQEQTQHKNYAAAWMLIHLLMHEDSDYAMRFRALLDKPDHAHTGAAIDEMLQRVPSAEIDRDLAQYLLKSIPWREPHLSPRSAPEVVTTRALADSEVLTLWARLDDFNGPNQARAEQRLKQAVQSDPRDEQASAWLDRFAKRSESVH